ncbi:MAG: hypothetical protein ACRELE_09400 [Gemmatimonadales bacterium]
MRLRHARSPWYQLASVTMLLLALAACRARRGNAAPRMAGSPATTDLPHHVSVEVLNSGGNIGAARVGMVRLRLARLDVVGFGNADSAMSGRIRNQVLVRRGDTTGVGRVIEAIGDADVIDAPDSTRLVDLTVLLGKAFLPGTGIRP